LKNSIKKILITHSSNDNYGASKVLISIINILIKNGFDIYLILPNNGPLNKNITIKKTNLQIINLGVFRKKYFTFFGLINRLYFIIKSSLYIKKFLKKNQIDLVYTNTSTLISPSIAAKLAGTPSIYHVHEIPKSSSIYAKFIAVFLNNFARNIICVSKSVKEFWINSGVNKNKLKIIYNGFNFKNSKSKNLKDDKIVFTCISRIIPYKGHLILVELFDKLCKINNKIYLQIVGDTLPEYQNYLIDLKFKIKKKGLSKNISFLGFQENTLKILSKSSFFIHTPISPDPLPTVIFEAIMSRTPVITNDLGGAYEILNNGINGLIINNDDINKSSKLIINYLKNQTQQTLNVEKAFEYVKSNFNYNKFENRINSTINKYV
tara:strand:- start:1912 stop:3045 length:1134 start_codon:yes stop_codon:yes gene_type:complete